LGLSNGAKGGGRCTGVNQEENVMRLEEREKKEKTGGTQPSEQSNDSHMTKQKGTKREWKNARTYSNALQRENIQGKKGIVGSVRVQRRKNKSKKEVWGSPFEREKKEKGGGRKER